MRCCCVDATLASAVWTVEYTSGESTSRSICFTLDPGAGLISASAYGVKAGVEAAARGTRSNERGHGLGLGPEPKRKSNCTRSGKSGICG